MALKRNAYDFNKDFNPNSDRQVSTYYFDRSYRLVKKYKAIYPNSAVLICTNNMRTRRFAEEGVIGAVVFDHTTAQEFAHLYYDKKGKLVIDDFTDLDGTYDPIRRTWLALIPPSELK